MPARLLRMIARQYSDDMARRGFLLSILTRAVLTQGLLLSACRAVGAEDLNVAAGLPAFDGSLTPALLGLATGLLIALVLHWRLRREVARRRDVEFAAVEERSRLNAILNNAGVGVLLADRASLHVDVNRHWCRMFGYRRQEVRGRLKARDIAHPDEADSLEALFRALLNGDITSHTQERRFVRKDGRMFWGLMATSTVEDKDGRQMWVVGMITDIDAQKRVEKALRESEQRLRFITESTQDVVWQVDRELRFTYVNRADERMRGYAREEVIGRPFRELIAPSGLPALERAMPLLPHLAGGEKATSFEVEMVCKDGGLVWVEINSTPIHDHSGQIAGYIGVTRDATERRQNQEMLREQTIRDPLTGLFNRRYLDESLERELSRARRESLPLSLVMIDIDRFKQLNDTHGHPAGDEVIKRIGDLIRKGARSADLPCRYGGEEFLLVLPNMPLDKAVERAEQWRVAFAEERIVYGGTVLAATLSAGVATFPAHGGTCGALIAAADQALYSAKQAGRDRVAVASRFIGEYSEKDCREDLIC